MNRFFCLRKDVSAENLTIYDRVQIHHMKDVLRVKEGEAAVVCDEKGCQYRAAVKEVSASGAVFTILQRLPQKDEPAVEITVACAIPKRSKIDDIIDKLTQVGVDRIIPMISERVIVKMTREKSGARKERWGKIALSACRQSQRANIPQVDEATDFKQVLALAKEFDLCLIPTLLGERKTIKEAVAGKKPQRLLVLIGPEGDFSPDEVRAALKAGFVPVAFGDTVLRVETAAVYAASVLSYEFK